MYLIFTNGILLYQGIDKRNEPIVVLDDSSTQGATFLTRRCFDLDQKKGFLLVDCGQKFKDREEHYIRKYNMRTQLSQQSLEGKKEIVKFFHDHVVEVKSVVKGNSTGS